MRSNSCVSATWGTAGGQFFSTDVYLYYLEQYLSRVWTEVEEDDVADGTAQS